MNGHVNIETQNPHKIQNIALQSLEEYKADLEEEEEEEEDKQERKKAKTKSKVRRAFISSLYLYQELFPHSDLKLEREQKIDEAGGGGASAWVKFQRNQRPIKFRGALSVSHD